MNRKFIAGVLLASLLFLVLSFSLSPSPSDDFVKTELYFGLSIPDGSSVTREEWNAFTDTVITATLVNGSTIVECRGFWSDNGRLSSEETRLVIALNPIDDRYANDNIETIRAKYKLYFHQQSVLRIDSKVKAAN